MPIKRKVDDAIYQRGGGYENAPANFIRQQNQRDANYRREQDKKRVDGERKKVMDDARRRYTEGKNNEMKREQKGNGVKKGSGIKSNPWFNHVNKVRSQKPSLSYKEALVEAKKTYKKGVRQKGGSFSDVPDDLAYLHQPKQKSIYKRFVHRIVQPVDNFLKKHKLISRGLSALDFKDSVVDYVKQRGYGRRKRIIRRKK